MKLWLLLLILMGPISLLVLMINLLLILMVPISLLALMINMRDLPAWEWCGSCETYPESGTCAECGTMYHRCDPSADDFLNTADLVIKHLELPLDPFIAARRSIIA